MLYLINIHWKRRTPHPDKPQTGRSTYPENARTLQAGKNKAVKKFNRHFGMNLAIENVAEMADPAGVFTGRRDCGSGQDYGICTACGRGHGHILMQSGIPSSLVTAAL